MPTKNAIIGNMEMVKMQRDKLLIEYEDFNLDEAMGKVIMAFTDLRETPYHGKLLYYNDYYIKIEDIYNNRLIINRRNIFYLQKSHRIEKS
ncbi:MAG: hypothetical protein PHG06_12350 [Parabacteroides sp.]|nr:hypothetical protein [Parabacteroides sp.]